jgi:hypothetical protein
VLIVTLVHSMIGSSYAVSLSEQSIGVKGDVVDGWVGQRNASHWLEATLVSSAIVCMVSTNRLGAITLCIFVVK